jgi:hypothetical protein
MEIISGKFPYMPDEQERNPKVQLPLYNKQQALPLLQI